MKETETLKIWKSNIKLINKIEKALKNLSSALGEEKIIL